VIDIDTMAEFSMLQILGEEITGFSNNLVQFSADQLEIINQTQTFLTVLIEGIEQRVLGLNVSVGYNNMSILNLLEYQLSNLTTAMAINTSVAQPPASLDNITASVSIMLDIMQSEGKRQIREIMCRYQMNIVLLS
jgi:hypothetical protein